MMGGAAERLRVIRAQNKPVAWAWKHWRSAFNFVETQAWRASEQGTGFVFGEEGCGRQVWNVSPRLYDRVRMVTSSAGV